jgi:hypothetical protein
MESRLRAAFLCGPRILFFGVPRIFDVAAGPIVSIR